MHGGEKIEGIYLLTAALLPKHKIFLKIEEDEHCKKPGGGLLQDQHSHQVWTNRGAFKLSVPPQLGEITFLV